MTFLAPNPAGSYQSAYGVLLRDRLSSTASSYSKPSSWDFPGGPVVKVSPSNARGMGSIPGWGTKIPHVLSHFSHVQTVVTLWTVACQAPLYMRLFRQEYWSGLPFPPPGSLPNPGIELRSPALQADSWSAELSGKPNSLHTINESVSSMKIRR